MPGDPVDVLVLAHDAAMGGAQLALIESIRGMASAGHRPIVVAPTPGPFVDTLHAHGIPCYWGMTQRWIFFRKPARGWLRHPALWALLSLLSLPLRMIALFAFAKLHHIKLVYSNTLTVIDGALVARLLAVPHIWHLHEAAANNPGLATPWPIKWLPAFILKCSDRVIVNSAYLRQRLFAALPQNRIRTIFNGVDVAQFHNVSPADLQPQVPAMARVTAIICGLSSQKRVEDYLRTAALISSTHPDVHHLVVGKGSCEYALGLKKLAADLGLGGNVHFLGNRKNIPALLARIEILVSTSAVETFGRTLIEAMAAGIPVIATRSGGPEEIVIDNKTGFLVDVGDVPKIAARMRELLDDRGLATTMGNAGKQRVKAFFSLDQVTLQIVEVINEALSEVS